MKKKSFLFLFLLSILIVSFAQKKNTSKVSISVGYGIGNVWTHFLKDAYPLNGYNVSAVGPISLICEYRLSNKISAGISGTYSKLNGLYSNNGFEFADQLTITTILCRANYHFIQTKKWDAYFGGGAGYVHSKYKSSVGTGSSNMPGSFGYSAQLGFKYDVLNRLGIYTEGGYVNGSFLQIGIVSGL